MSSNAFNRLTHLPDGDSQSDVTIFYEGLEGTIVVPHTLQAAQSFGVGTNWDFASLEEQCNTFALENLDKPIFVYLAPSTNNDDRDVGKFTGRRAIFKNENFQDENGEIFLKRPVALERLLIAALWHDNKPNFQIDYIRKFGGFQEDKRDYDHHKHMRNKQDPSLPQEWNAAFLEMWSSDCEGIKKDYPHLLENDDFMWAAVKRGGHIFCIAPERFKNNRDFVVAAVTEDWQVLYDVADHFKDDKKLVELSMDSHEGGGYAFASDRIQLELALKAKEMGIYSALPEEFRHDKEAALKAVQRSGSALKGVPPPLNRDRDIIKAALSGEGRSLAFAHVPEDLKCDSEILRWAFRAQYLCSMYLPIEGDIAKHSPKYLIPKLIPEATNEKDFMLDVVAQSGFLFKIASDLLKGDRELAVTAATNCEYAYIYADLILQMDEDFICDCFAVNPEFFSFYDCQQPQESMNRLQRFKEQLSGRLDHQRRILQGWLKLPEPYKDQTVQNSQAIQHMHHLSGLWGHPEVFGDLGAALALVEYKMGIDPEVQPSHG